jgi:hypothetical protein
MSVFVRGYEECLTSAKGKAESKNDCPPRCKLAVKECVIFAKGWQAVNMFYNKIFS